MIFTTPALPPLGSANIAAPLFRIGQFCPVTCAFAVTWYLVAVLTQDLVLIDAHVAANNLKIGDPISIELTITNVGWSTLPYDEPPENIYDGGGAVDFFADTYQFEVREDSGEALEEQINFHDCNIYGYSGPGVARLSLEPLHSFKITRLLNRSVVIDRPGTYWVTCVYDHSRDGRHYRLVSKPIRLEIGQRTQREMSDYVATRATRLKQLTLPDATEEDVIIQQLMKSLMRYLAPQ